MSSNREKILVAAVDIGTTYSGYAFSFKHEYIKDPTKVTINPPWNGGRLLSLKTPTCVLCNPNREFHSFGYEAEDKYAELFEDKAHHGWYFFRRFKTVLYEKQINKGIEVEDDKGLKMRAATVFAMAIRYLKEHLLHTMIKMKTRVKVEDIHWVLTVPAIWTDSAKDFMRDAAMMAGIDVRNLIIAMEPEAAIMYCQLLPSDDLSSNARFDDKNYIVIDLGGEMVDITVHEKQADGTMIEVHKASSGACGGANVDENFNQMIIKIIGARAFKKFCEENLADHLDMCREFEIKKSAVHMNKKEKITINVPAALAYEYEKISGETIMYAIEQSPYRGKIRCTIDKMRLDAELFRSLFQNCITKITEYLLETPVVTGLSTLIMVGGFSQCQLIQAAVKRTFPNLKVVIPFEGGLAILKGAAILGHKLGIACNYNFPRQPSWNKDNSPMTTMFDNVDTNLPYEILRMDKQSQNLYREALSAGTEKVYNIRLMIVGHMGVGKTALAQRLLNEEVKEDERESTEGIEVHSTHWEIDHMTKEWRIRKEDELAANTQRIAEILKKHKRDTENQQEENSTAVRSVRSLYYESKSTIKTGHAFIAPTRVDKQNEESNIYINSPSCDIEQTKQKMLFSHPEDGNHDRNVNVHPELRIKGSSSHNKNKNPGAKNSHADVEEIQDIVKRAKSLTLHGKDVSYLTVLDFAGQFLYYTTHQAFMSWRTLYLLVTDISLSLTDAVEEDVSGCALSWNKTRTVQEYISYWMNSVHSHAKKQVSGREGGELQGTISQYAPVILVATHMDKISKEQAESKKKWYFETIRRNLSNSELIHHLTDEDFAISNLGSDHNIENLKKKILDLAQKQSYWGEPIPARWLTLEKVLLERKREGKPVLDYSEVERLNQSRQVKIDKAEELVLFLQFEHDLGNVVFFFTERLRLKVVLDPEWVIRGVTTLVTSDEIVRRYPGLSAQWYKFKDTGRLTRKLIDSIWSHHKEFHDNKEHLLGVLEELNIITKPILKKEDPNEDYFWVPCMVHATAPETVKAEAERKDVTKTSTLCFESKTRFIHVGVFHRLLATCLSKWMPATKDDKSLIFAGLCVLELEHRHELLLSLNDFVIQATVMRHTSIELPPDLNLCIEVKEFLHLSLSEISKYICPNSEYSVSIMCSRSAFHINGDRHKIDFLRENKGNEIRCRSHSGTHRSSEELLGHWEKCFVEVGRNDVCAYLTSDRHLSNVAGKLGTEWYFLALRLGLNSSEIQQIRMNHPCDSRFQIFTALTKWAQRSSKDNKEKVRELVNALNAVERTDLAKELESELLSITENT